MVSLKEIYCIPLELYLIKYFFNGMLLMFRKIV